MAKSALFFALRSRDRLGRFAAFLAVSTVEAKQGQIERALKDLQVLRAESAHQGFVGFEMQARLRIGELQLRSPHPLVGKTTLQQLREDATGRGFLLISRKAATALENSAPRGYEPAGGGRSLTNR